jgi:hypothetical protein
MPNVETILRDHVTLNLDCIDRLYLNGYVPGLQRPDQLFCFLRYHRGKPIVSPALLKQLSDGFVAAILGFAQRHNVPIVRFERGQRKEDVARQRLARFKRDEGVVFIGVAQEKVAAFRAVQKGPRRRHRTLPGGRPPRFSFFRGTVDVNQYYFYILDRDFGLCFIKFSSYCPFGVRIWVNGHEWAKRQLARRGVDFEELDNGFFACDDPQALQRVCDSLSADHIDRFLRRWQRQLPHPYTREDRRAGYRYQLSILQMEVSLTQVFDRPLRGREFFEEVIRDNLDLGRPDRVQLHFKLGRALRTETTFHDTYDFAIRRALGSLSQLRTLGRNINHRLLTLERVAQHCAIASQTVERIVLPTVDDGQRAPALRWGDPRTTALLAALCAFMVAPAGFTNRSLRERVAALHDSGPRGYTVGRMTYDLRRLRLKRLVARVPHSHRYVLTPLGRRVALFMTKSFARVVRPVLHRLDPSLPDDASAPLCRAWRACERELDHAVAEAKMAA